MPSQPRVLLTTAYREGPLYDYFGSNIRPTLFRLAGKRPISLGLRFIKQNVPGIEILEMPTAAQYRRALTRGWDIVGISFYIDETPRRWRWPDRHVRRALERCGAATMAH